MSLESKLVAQLHSTTDCFNVIRGQIEHEDNLMVRRLNWFITSQSFFFSAYAVDITSFFSSPPQANSEFTDTRQLLRILIPLVAIIATGAMGARVQERRKPQPCCLRFTGKLRQNIK